MIKVSFREGRVRSFSRGLQGLSNVNQLFSNVSEAGGRDFQICVRCGHPFGETVGRCGKIFPSADLAQLSLYMALSIDNLVKVRVPALTYPCDGSFVKVGQFMRGEYQVTEKGATIN